MNAIPRSVTQPGKPAAQRIESIAGEAAVLELSLTAGLNLRDAIVRPLLQAGLTAATVRIEQLEVQSLHYVRPAAAADDRHAAFYSEPHAIAGPIRIALACVTVGRRDDAPFVHCHAIWQMPDGAWQGGHVFADQVVVGATARAQAWGVANAVMQADYDEETNFTLFHPIPAALPVSPASFGTAVGADRELSGGTCIVARIRPNQDLIGGIEAVCRTHGIRKARICGSVGSIIGARFADGSRVDDRETEILVLEGSVRDDGNGPRAELTVALIDPRGDIHRGDLLPGENPVLICFELVLHASAAH